MSEIRVSVVIPARDAEATLAASLAALCPQVSARADAELIVVDNGSRDRTREIAGASCARVLEHLPPGAAAARNVGWRAARGELVAFLDSDCIPQPGWLDALVEALDTKPFAGAAGGLVRAAGPSGLLQRYAAAAGYYLNQEEALNFPYMPFLLTCNCCYRRSALDRLGGLDESLYNGDDVDIAWRMQVDLGLQLAFAPEAVVEHVHRDTLRGIWRQWSRYGFGAVQMEARYPDLPRPTSSPTKLSWRLLVQLIKSARAFAGLASGRAQPEDVLAPLLRCFEVAANRSGRRQARRVLRRG